MSLKIEDLFSDWSEELALSLAESQIVCLALFDLNGNLLFSNKKMNELLIGDPKESLLNPTFERLATIKTDINLIYRGYLTLGSYTDDNTSIKSKIYKKNDNILIIGSIDAQQLVEQNQIMLDLNKEISNLQRQLIKEKHDLNKANFELNEANASKDRFFSILAHDLKNPFNIILGFSELLKDNIRIYSIDDIEEQVNHIYKSSKYTYGLFEELLLWSKSQSGRIKFQPEKIAFSEAYDEVKKALLPQLQNKNIFLTAEIDEKARLYADKNMLKTILRNIISNAIKYSFENTEINLKIEKNDNSRALISVTDNGIGISKANQDKLFKLSETVSSEGTAKEKGSGLGLLLCKDFVEKHDCKIWVESELGKGSTFKFTMPCCVE